MITGAAGIVGPEICRNLRAKGWLVAAADREKRDFEMACQMPGGECFHDFLWLGDISGKEACQELVAATESALGPIGLLVNNAAASFRAPSLREIEEEQAIGLLKVNLLAPFWLIGAAEESLRVGRGTVVNISSAQTRGWLPDNHLYVASKAALEKLTETLSGRLSTFGVKVFCLRLGSFPGTHFLRDYLRLLPKGEAHKMMEEVLPVHFESIRETLGASRVGKPEDLARFIAFLASEESRMLNGAVLDFDGGYTRRPTSWGGPPIGPRLAREWFERWQASAKGDEEGA